MTPVSADSKLVTLSWQCPKAIGTKQERGVQSSPMRFPSTVVGVVIVNTLANVNSSQQYCQLDLSDSVL